MSGDGLSDRGRALEEAFFAKQNEMLRQKLHQAGDAKAKREAFASASGITDDAVLDKLIAMGIGVETLAALGLVPLVLVAWADGSIDAKERAAVLAGAAETGLADGQASRELLESWLDKRPAAELLATWTNYIGAISATLDAPAKESLKEDLLGRARAVAEAAGGMLGLGRRVSAAEEGVLRDLEAAFAT